MSKVPVYGLAMCMCVCVCVHVTSMTVVGVTATRLHTWSGRAHFGGILADALLLLAYVLFIWLRSRL